MTLVVPLLNGAPADTSFVRHAAIVLAVSACALLVGKLWRHLHRHLPTPRAARTNCEHFFD
jgi:hypothetical protein